MNPRNRSRWLLLLIVAIFFAPFISALYLYYTNWQPSHTKNYGQLLHPVRDLRAVAFVRADGSRFAFDHMDHVWRVLVAPPVDCGDACVRLADTLRRIWIGLGRNADRVQVLWVGAAPKPGFRNLVIVRADNALTPSLPDVATREAIPVYVVDPSGYLFMRYPPGFDPDKMRRDLAQLLK